MRVVSRQADAVFDGYGWLPDVLCALEQHHLVAWSELTRRRNMFCAALRRGLASQPDVDACVIHGRGVLSLDHLCQQIERTVPAAVLERRIDGPDGLTELLRDVPEEAGHRPPRFRYWIWSDADVFLRADPRGFASVVDCMLGVAAESEYGVDEGATIQRGIFVGGPMLERYAMDARGGFRSWKTEGPDDSDAFWKLVSGLERPPVLCRPVDMLTREQRRLGA